MASVELLCINNNTQTCLQDNGNWEVNTSFSKSETHIALKTCSCESQCNVLHQTVKREGYYDPPSNESIFQGSHMKFTYQHFPGEVKICCDQDLETSFTYIDENVNLHRASPPISIKSHPEHINHSPCSGTINNVSQELSMFSDEGTATESSSSSVDYGFISAVILLVTGIILVMISYIVPRDVNVKKDTVSAREMERLENASAKLGAHLDRCVIAGLCLLTLGGVILSILLMMTFCYGEMYRCKRLASSKESTKLYGSINFRPASECATQTSKELTVTEENSAAVN
ncbi:transmembrane protein 74 [Protopterus annectens]|uniref:transmembrane protein 74 n=1 Tax=Protopterus annectens TaxID=7888 RepID=UPI001CF97343|nr:transmembrane protein 74 [Protopterus annectens]